MRRQQPEYPVLSTTTIVFWAVGLVGVAAVAVVLLWTILGGGEASTELNVIQTAGSIVVGTGGAAALLLTARKQRSTELDLRQKDHDATERRVTELYGSAADQLGSDKAAVRLAGLYALERLAQDNPPHRQTIVNLICAYLRMPFEPPAGRSDELEVRQIAQVLLATHLRPAEGARFWADIEVNLSGATLVKFGLTNCVVRSALFHETVFADSAIFRGTEIRHSADFRHVRFHGLADFRRVTFGDDDRGFRGGVFEGEVDFGTTTPATLTGARSTVACDDRRKWPAGWAEQPSPDDPALNCLVKS